MKKRLNKMEKRKRQLEKESNKILRKLEMIIMFRI